MTKLCVLSINQENCYYRLYGCTNEEMIKIIEYKSWIFKSWKTGTHRRYFVFLEYNRSDVKILRSSIGFAPILIRYLQYLGYIVSGKELFKSRDIILGNIRYELWDFQKDAVNKWINSGCCGVIKASTGSGKCCKKGTLLLTNRGILKIEDIVNESYKRNYIEIDDIYEENRSVDSIYTLDYGLNYVNKSIENKYDMSENDIIEIKTEHGYTIGATPEHKIVVMDSDGHIKFKRMDKIENNDYVVITSGTNVYNKELRLFFESRNLPDYAYRLRFEKIHHMNEDLAELMGYIIAEGSDAIYESGTVGFVQITNYDEEIWNRCIEIGNNLGLNPKLKYDKKRREKPTGIIVNSIEFVNFIYYLGYKKGAKNKEVPWSILQSNKKCQRAFLRALFDGDGTVDLDHESVEYYTSSYELAKQIHIMLLNMGIVSRLAEKKGVTIKYQDTYFDDYYIKKYEKSYRITIYGKYLILFNEMIGFGLTRKKDILNEVIVKLKNRKRWSKLVVPNIHMMIKKLDDIVKKSKYIYVRDRYDTYSYRKLLRVYGFEGMNMWCDGRRSPSKTLLKRILNMYSNVPDIVDMDVYKYLKRILEYDIIFDKVVNINKSRDNVYDLTVSELHSYIGNGFVNHNTVMAMDIMRRLSVRTIICVHTSDLMVNVWYNNLIEQFGDIIKNRIGLVGGGLNKNERLEMRLSSDSSYEGNMDKDIVICTAQTLLRRLDDLVKRRFGLLILDECHRFPAEQFRKVASCISAPFRLGLSATLLRPDGMSPMIHGLVGDVVYKIGIKELVRKGFLVEPIFNTIIINDEDIQSDILSCGLRKLEYSRYIKKKSASSDVKKNYIIDLVKSLVINGKRFLMYTDFVSKNGSVYVRDDYVKELNNEGVRCVGVASEMSGGEREQYFDMLKSGHLDGLVFGKLGSEGVNIPVIDSVIMCNATKSTILYPQRVGRAMRITDESKKHCFVYEICLNLDKELEWSDENFYEYRSEGYTKEKIFIKDGKVVEKIRGK